MHHKILLLTNISLDTFISFDYLVYKKDNTIICNKLQGVQVLLFEQPNNFVIEYFDNQYIIARDIIKIIKVNHKKSLISSIPIRITGKMQIKLFDNDTFVIRHETDNVWSVKLLNLEGEVLSVLAIDYPFRCVFVQNLLLGYSSHDNTMFAFDKIQDRINWEISFVEVLNSTNTKQFGEIIFYRNFAYLYLSDFKKYGIYCLDIQTGTVINSTDKVAGFIKLANDTIYFIQNNAYELVELNPITFQYDVTNFETILKPLGLDLGHKNLEVFTENFFYFVSEKLVKNATITIGIIDLQTKQLVETIGVEITDDGYGISKIEVHDNRLFVLTNGGTLHIFERMED